MSKEAEDIPVLKARQDFDPFFEPHLRSQGLVLQATKCNIISVVGPFAKIEVQEISFDNTCSSALETFV
ncbi:hypothetical protein BC826DRAFT_1059230, partial [Russula brevipes]